MHEYLITLQGRVPSKKNSKRRIQRGRHVFMVPSEAHEVWHMDQMFFLKNLWKSNEMIENVQKVYILFSPPDARKADLSNKAESIMDLLVDAGIIKDDNWFDIPDLHLVRADIDRENPRAVVIITT